MSTVGDRIEPRAASGGRPSLGGPLCLLLDTLVTTTVSAKLRRTVLGVLQGVTKFEDTFVPADLKTNETNLIQRKFANFDSRTVSGIVNVQELLIRAQHTLRQRL